MGSPLSFHFAVGGFALGLILALSPSCTPPACKTSNCTGCCDATGTCQTGTASNACGVNGTACGVCSGAQSCRGGQCGGGGGNGGGAGGGGGSSGGSFAQFCQSFAAAYCDGLVSCGSLDTAARNACVNYFVAGDCYAASPSHTKGYSTFAPGASAACLASVQAEFASCSQPSPSCVSDALAPAAGLGQTCIDSSDCKDPGTACGGANICGRTCQTTGGLNQPCGFSFPSCNANLYCEQQSQTCRAVKTAGATCANPGECDANSYCDSTQQRCIALPTNGQTCRSGFPNCAANAWCDFSVTPNLCRSRAAVGQSCATSQCVTSAWCNTALNPPACAALKSSGQPCGSGSECANTRCTSGVCFTPSGETQPCQSTSDCQTGLSCDYLLNSCERLEKNLLSGASCTFDTKSCAPGLKCKNARTNPDGGTGTRGTCGTPTLGDSCSSDSDCPRESHCAPGATRTCTASIAGSPCRFNESCRAQDYCAKGAQSQCAPRLAQGQACSGGSSNDCVKPLQCVPTSTSTAVCGTLGGEGASCVIGVSESGCKLLFDCVSGTCRAVGLNGQACLSSTGECLEGACQGRNPDAGVVGTCGAPAPDGTRCDRYQLAHCAGFCDQTTSVCASCP